VYHQIKIFVKGFLPAKLLFQLEPKLRSALSIFYRGSKHQCTVCKIRLNTFVSQGDDLLCPNCGSLARTRRLWQLLNDEFIKPGMTILDFSPARSIFRALKKKRDITYHSTDLSGDFLSDFQFDITNVACANETYDLVICYHILEHIENDSKAISELYRIIKSKGTVLIQTPFKTGITYENPQIVSPADRLAHFGQEDHVRIYSLSGLCERLSAAGFEVETRKFNAEEDNYHGYSSSETVIVCRKNTTFNNSQ